MLKLKLYFENDDTVTTGINLNFEDAQKYYIGNVFQIGISPNENKQRCIKIERI